MRGKFKVFSCLAEKSENCVQGHNNELWVDFLVVFKWKNSTCQTPTNNIKINSKKIAPFSRRK